MDIIGFISPDGEFIQCNYTEHITVSEQILRKLNIETVNSEDDLANLGWMFIQRNFVGIPSTNGNIPFTDKQMNWILEHYDDLNSKQRYFISEKLKIDDEYKNNKGYPDFLTHVDYSGLI